MNQLEDLSELAKLSSAIGQDIAYVQGGGGNISVKTDETTMLIKASGWPLSKVTEKNGYCSVNYQEICKYIKTQAASNDNDFSAAIYSFVTSKGLGLPSIETGLHTLFEKFVIHTHSVYVNLLTCSQNGQKIVEDLFSDCLWIDYHAPGRELTLKIEELLNQRSNLPNIVFLENHGIIISANSSSKALNIHQEVNEKILAHFGHLTAFSGQKLLNEVESTLENVLFPDQVVYTLNGDTILSSVSGKETQAAFEYLLHSMQVSRLIPKFLNRNQVETILNMQSEKHRQLVATK